MTARYVKIENESEIYMTVCISLSFYLTLLLIETLTV